ncbi:APC family permease [Rhodococcus qingshengii]|uniref:APC family permease n=1 Tax=Rhodococcus qingshengii TaxID=334542 RepID=UPI001BE808DC|nr:APC family permease [Rhodococcus qingshengii]MBT2270008.1 APC family permease [Rhodococcus qingshengii]
MALVLTVMAYLAPLTAAAGYLPLVIGYGNGLGAPVTFLLLGALFALFAVGFLALVRHIPKPGAFYAYISEGLGKRIGLGAGALTLVFYFFAMVSTYIFAGVQIQAMVQRDFGVDLQWWVWSAVICVFVGACSYRAIDFSARLVGIVVCIEVAVILIFDVATLAKGGAEGISAEPFTWTSISSGSIAVAVLFSVGILGGFESTAIYRDEVRDPDRTIPRATYAVIAILTVFSSVATYCIIIALGPSNAVAMASEDPSGTFTGVTQTMVGSFFTQVVSVVLITSILACLLSVTNVATRYIHSFSVDGVFPEKLGSVHPRHGSPHKASLATNAVVFASIVVFAVSEIDPQVAYGVLGGVGNFAFQTLIILVSIAVIFYFRRTPGTGQSAWRVVVAPALSAILFVGLIVNGATHVELLLGEPTPLTTIGFAVLIISFVGGLGYASFLAVRRPDSYARLGRSKG